MPTLELLAVVVMLIFYSPFSGGEIAGVIISSLIGVGIVVAVPLAVFCFIKWLKKPPPGMLYHSIGSDVIINDVIIFVSAPEANELSEMAPPDLEVVVEQDTGE